MWENLWIASVIVSTRLCTMCVRLWAKPGCLAGDNTQAVFGLWLFVGTLWMVIPRASHVLRTGFAHLLPILWLDI